ncbi:MAG: hypothetical protein L6R40_002909 [Gallowayella cf. fulva]|nr:MAG: hypothetical protein L6R40_002909 [Xanthomendoza cf. fulva]
MLWPCVVVGSVLCTIPLGASLDINVNDIASVKSTARTVVSPLIGFYNGSQQGFTPNAPFKRDDAGAALFGALIDYWHYTGDGQYNRLATELLAASTDANPPLNTETQGMWALGAMSAAESDFPLDPLNEIPSWLGYAQRVFDVQVARWDTQTCGGGIHWLFSPDGVSSQRYNYKNSITHGVLFQLAARLARYTGNQTYIDWADRTWDWTTSVKLITPDFRVYDGVTSTDGCRDVVPLQWSYNAAVFLYGSAVMSNQTNANPQWQNITQNLFSSLADTFFTSNSYRGPGAPSNVLVEVACEPYGSCIYDQWGFKGLTAQWMGATIRTAPFLANRISSALQVSARAAVGRCLSKDNGTLCGSDWVNTTTSKAYGFEPQLSTLGIVIANLAANSTPPVTAKTATRHSSSGADSGSAQSWTLRAIPSPSQLISVLVVLVTVGYFLS